MFALMPSMPASSAQLGTTYHRWLAILVVCLTGACVNSHGERADRAQADASGMTPTDPKLADATAPIVHDGGADRQQPFHSDSGTSPAQPTTFVLENAGAQPVVLGSNCGGSWLRIERAGREIEFDRACRCSCRDKESTQGCASCPAVCTSTQKQLAPGLNERLAWDGIQLDSSQGQGCYVEAAFPSGTELTATACWNLDAQTGKGTCISKRFVYGVDREVVLSAEPVAAEPSSIAFTLENRTGAAIDLTDYCGGVSTWFNIGAPGVKTSTGSFCPCTCVDQYRQSSCPTCGGCVEDVVHSVAPGATHTSVWNGRLVYTYPSGCAGHYAAPVGSPLTVEFCWRLSGSDAGTATCRQSEIVHGVEAVTLIAQ
jgi:hypothetical protein